MSNKIDFAEELSKFIFASKYSRYDADLGRRETWDETVDRVRSMHLKKFRSLPKEDKDKIKWAFELVKERRVVPSLRSLQFGGKAIEAHNTKIYNCTVLHVDSIRAFAESMYLLLNGCGVGFGLNKKFLGRLPDLVDKSDKTGSVIVYTVDDNIEGWANSIEALLMCYFRNTAYTGKKLVIDYSKIRPEGAQLKTSGGKAPGFKGLKACHRKIKALLDHLIEEEGVKRLRPIHAYDILMHCCDAVLSGGVRRSACSVIFDKDDAEMANAKVNFTVSRKYRFSFEQDKDRYIGKVIVNGKTYEVELSKYEYEEILVTKNEISWIHIEPQRARSNNSVLLERNDTSYEEFKRIIEKAKIWGEPAFVFGVKDQLFNPCVRGDTLILTKNGSFSINSLVGQETEIWNGFGWSKVTPKVTGYNQPMLKVTLSNGKSLVCTFYHEWLIPSFDKKGYEKIKAIDLKVAQTIWQPNGEVSPKVHSIEYAGIDEKVYCFYEPERNLGTFNGIVTGQCFEVSFIPLTQDGQTGVQVCNLTSINGSKVTTTEEFTECVEAATILGTLQAAFTNFKFLRPTAKQLTEEEALLGVSITGFLDSPDILLNPDNLTNGAKHAIEVNKVWAKKLGINQAARITLVKPEGCQSPDTQIVTDKGIFALSELGNMNGDKWQDLNIKVSTDKGDEQASKFFVNGFTDTYKITTDAGITLECTPNHKYRVLTNNGEYVWKESRDIVIGDMLVSKLGGYTGGEYQKFTFEFTDKTQKKSTSIQLPEYLNEELAWAFGLYVGDGSNHEKGIRVSGDNREREDLIKFGEIIKKYFGLEYSIALTQPSAKDNRCQLYVNSVQFLAFLQQNNLFKPKTLHINIPLIVRKSPPSVLKAFIQGYAAADGSTKTSTQTYCTTSLIMAKQLVACLRALGVDCKMREMPPTESSFGNNMRYWISERKGRASKINHKSKIWEQLDDIGLTDCSVDEVIKKEESECMTLDIEVPTTHTYVSNSYISHNTNSLFLKSAPGAHPHHAKRYFRRVQCNKSDTVYKYFKQINPHATEEGVWSANKTDDVITFPIQVSDKCMVKADLTAIKHLEIAKMIQQNWVIPGTTEANKKPIVHNVSLTVIVKDEEWDEVIKYLYDNKEYFTAVSLLPYVGDKIYKQAPMEAVVTQEDIEKWDALIANWKPMDYAKLEEEEDNTIHTQEPSCVGGQCLI